MVGCCSGSPGAVTDHALPSVCGLSPIRAFWILWFVDQGCGSVCGLWQGDSEASCPSKSGWLQLACTGCVVLASPVTSWSLCFSVCKVAARTLARDKGCPWLSRSPNLLSVPRRPPFLDCFSPRCLHAWLLACVRMSALLRSALPREDS